jgi:predicted membrane channel-forming protein YqfA (hemolysin III family)
MAPSPTSWRKIVAAGAIVLLIAVWALIVASLAHMVGRWPVLVQAPFYLFMGVVWIIPLKPLLSWAETGHLRARSKGDN